MSSCYLVWLQNCSSIQQIVILQKKLLELIIFNQEIAIPVPYSNKTPSKNFMINYCLENISFVSKSLDNSSLSVLVHGLVFTQINITMKPQALHWVIS